MKTKILYSGRSMIEMLGVLAIMGIITGMSIAAYNMAMSTLKSGRVSEELLKIQQSVKSLYSEGTYTGIKTETFISLGTLQEIPGSQGTKAKNQYGGEYILEEGQNGLSYKITMTMVTKGDCTQFVTKKQEGVVSITVNGSTWNASSGQPTATALVPQCRDESTVTFEYR